MGRLFVYKNPTNLIFFPEIPFFRPVSTLLAKVLDRKISGLDRKLFFHSIFSLFLKNSCLHISKYGLPLHHLLESKTLGGGCEKDL
jgi:hypothetical protein